MTRPGLDRVVAVLVATLLWGGTAYLAAEALGPGRYAWPAALYGTARAGRCYEANLLVVAPVVPGA